MLKLALIVSAVGISAAAVLMVNSANALPDLNSIQTAYERELARGTRKHDPGLHVRAAECNPVALAGPETFVCSIKFTTTKDRDERLYLDIVQVAREQTGWSLKSGLCRS